MTRRRNDPLWIGLFLLIAVTALGLSWLVHSTVAVRAAARERFFEQYNRQQLLLAEQASRSIEDLFRTFRKDLGLVVSLFEGGEVSAERCEEVRGSLAKVQESLADTPVIDLAIFDREGTVVASFPPSPGTVGTNLAWRDYFSWARDEGRPGQLYLTPLRRQAAGAVFGEKALNVVEGIYGEGGTFKGLALFTVNFDELARRHVLSVRIGEQGYAWLADVNDETVLVDPRGRIAGQSFREAFLPRWPGLYSLVLSTRDGRPGTTSYDYEDPADPSLRVRKLVAFHPVKIEGRLWTLGVSTPQREVEALLSSFLHRQEVSSAASILGILAGTAVLGSLLVLWNRTLSGQVSARTRDLERARADLEAAFEELLAARKLAAVGQLAAGLAHEIRNPLSSIRMNVQMIREEMPRDERLHENFDIVEGEVKRLNGLLNDVLGFARPRPLRLATADLGVEVRGVLQLTERLLAEEGVEVEFRAPEDLRAVCDAEQVRQVLLNLVLNAVESMRGIAGRKALTVVAGRQDGTAILRVTDTGPGVRPEDQARIFDPFYTTKAQGGGLGLATVQSIVVRHRGTVDVESDGRSGATFSVRLPVAGPAASEEGAS